MGSTRYWSVASTAAVLIGAGNGPALHLWRKRSGDGSAGSAVPARPAPLMAVHWPAPWGCVCPSPSFGLPGMARARTLRACADLCHGHPNGPADAIKASGSSADTIPKTR